MSFDLPYDMKIEKSIKKFKSWPDKVGLGVPTFEIM